ncbi:MAG TPA: phenylalanine--tRNA ligase subunit alpha [Candidatus Baltobacteraceae bacterium]|jgi:phenylalanyl-tRNA synthetase alpha chain|nr:phenylalanine--tRNA ligase subunit alpha [Candidatus Baltobacteraceae bacterium]
MTELQPKLHDLQQRFKEAAAGAGDEAALDALRVAFLGRSGEVTLLRRTIGQLAPAERPDAGRVINEAVEQMESELAIATANLEARSFDAELEQSIDVTFPAIPAELGSIHPVRRVLRDACAYFERHGFAVVLGPEIEPDYYAFDALNIPASHPAREGFDSFWITDTLLLRPHTSPMQVRTMQAHKPPIAVVAPGRCYRRDAVDARHLFQFNQVEGLLIAEGIHFGHLKGMLTGLCRELFGADQRVRFRPSFFPFTEPSAEVDTTCPKCKGAAAACNMCGGSGWIELGGAGMVHPNVLTEAGYDTDVFTGWAFGFGIERLGLTRYDIDDIRRFVDSDPDFLAQLA